MFAFLDSFVPKKFSTCLPLGNGRAVSASVVIGTSEEEDCVIMSYQRKLRRADAKGGKLQAIAQEGIRGNKRVLSHALSYEAAEAMHRALGDALKRARRQRRRRRIWDTLIAFIWMNAELKISS